MMSLEKRIYFYKGINCNSNIIDFKMFLFQEVCSVKIIIYCQDNIVLELHIFKALSHSFQE